jgi:hypothetical protein
LFFLSDYKNVWLPSTTIGFNAYAFFYILTSFLLNSVRRVFWLDYLYASSIKCVVGKKIQKRKKKKKLLFCRNNERFIWQKEKTVTHTHTQQYVISAATDHCNLFNSFDLNYSTVVQRWATPEVSHSNSIYIFKTPLQLQL